MWLRQQCKINDYIAVEVSGGESGFGIFRYRYLLAIFRITFTIYLFLSNLQDPQRKYRYYVVVKMWDYSKAENPILLKKR